MPSLQDRARGCLIGLACGDAVGTALEFQQRGSFEPVYDMVGASPFDLDPGQWTDDTCWTLFGGAPDAVFSSEPYGTLLAEVMSQQSSAVLRRTHAVHHFAVDNARTRVPISATKIRSNLHQHRKWLPPEVYADFVKRICFKKSIEWNPKANGLKIQAPSKRAPRSATKRVTYLASAGVSFLLNMPCSLVSALAGTKRQDCRFYEVRRLRESYSLRWSL